MERRYIIEPPTAINNMWGNLALQLAAKMGCSDCRYKPGKDTGGIYCPASCNPCKIPALWPAFEEVKTHIAARQVTQYTDDLLLYAMHAPEPWAPELPFKELA